MDWFTKINQWYKMWIDTDGAAGWSLDMVNHAVVKGKITQTQAGDIVGGDNIE